jgi:phosphoglycerate kinase
LNKPHDRPKTSFYIREYKSMKFKRMSELDLRGKRVLIREDLNVPIEGGVITATQRLEAALPAIKQALSGGAAVLLMSHLGRPKEGVFDAKDSLAPIATWLSEALGQTVPLIRDYLDGVEVRPGQVVLLENVRMNVGEGDDDETLARRYAELADVFVMDAFGTAHRAQASTHGVGRFAKIACAGPLLSAELEALGKALLAPAKPMLAIVAGSKVSTKLALLENLIERVDQLIVGGGIANTFLAAAGFKVAKSLHEPDLIAHAARIADKARSRGASIPLPSDVVVAGQFSADAPTRTCKVDLVRDGEMILDIGPATQQSYRELIALAGTVVWNGPVGVFEFASCAEGTRALASAIADSPAFSIAGGGDTLAAIEQFGVESGISYISTGGGAFLEFLEGKTLPAVAMLEARASG